MQKVGSVSCLYPDRLVFVIALQREPSIFEEESSLARTGFDLNHYVSVNVVNCGI